MNELWAAMGRDMKIVPYEGESDCSYLRRLCFSGLGLWCLKSAQAPKGISKSAQTRLLDNLLYEFQKYAPIIADYFSAGDKQRVSFPVMVRQAYEETGYLLTGENSWNSLAPFGRTVPVGEKQLYFGVPSSNIEMNGLGVFSGSSDYCSSVQEFLIRDELDAEQYFETNFDLCDFEVRDINLSDMEFFSPRKKASPSYCWTRTLDVDCTVCRKAETGPYYRLMRLQDGQILFSNEERSNVSAENLLSHDYRRLYYALKAHYGRPSKVGIREMSSDYSAIKLPGYLPNREYYFLLLTSWPKQSAFDRTQFIVKNELLKSILELLQSLGIECEGER